ncbi:MAG: RNA 2',3'-cyclic phosphodiesterase [Vicinamibacterales bacterium]
MARLFTAIELTADVRESIVRNSASFVRGFDADTSRRLRRVRPEHLHVTLVFLGEIPEADIGTVTAAMTPPFSMEPFDIAFATAGTFPSRGPARVLWLGVGEGSDACRRLHDDVVTRLATVGVPDEDRRFTAHVTIGRWPERSGPFVHGDAKPIAGIPPLRVSSVTLFRSYLRPQGPEHTPLLVTPLAGRDTRLH